jgi:hypothetical protein
MLETGPATHSDCEPDAQRATPQEAEMARALLVRATPVSY